MCIRDSSIPYAAVELTRKILGTLENKKVLLLGAGKMSELSARGLLNHGASSVCVINRTLEHATELAAKLGGIAVPFEERWQHMAAADVIISSTSCPHTILSGDEAEMIDVYKRQTQSGEGHHSDSSAVNHGSQNKPRLIFWELTKGCNLRCIHCRASATELSSPNDLSTATAKAIIDQIAEISNPILVLSGGEPLFRSDIFELARYGTEKGLRVALATNGTLVTRQVAQKIVDAGVKRVAISLDLSLIHI